MLKASNDYITTVKATEECLRKLELTYVKNGNDKLAEFEIGERFFRIVVEPSKMPQVHNFPVRSLSLPKGSTIEIRFDIDLGEGDLRIATEQAKLFVEKLINELPVKPWNGLGGFLNREERNWRNFVLI